MSLLCPRSPTLVPASLQEFPESPQMSLFRQLQNLRGKLDRQHHISAFKLLILMTVSKPGSLTLNVRVCYASYFKEKKNHLIFLLASHISMRRHTSEISVRGSYLQLNSDRTEAETEKQAHHSEIHATSHIDTDSLVLRDRLLEITKQRAVHFANPPVFLLLFLLEEKNVCLSC